MKPINLFYNQLIGIFILFSIFCFSSCKAMENFNIFNEDSIYSTADLMPTFPGGQEKLNKFINENIKWPGNFDGLGTVIISLVVEKDGSLSNIIIKRTLCSLCDDEAKRIISMMPHWIPGKIKGKNVRVMTEIPIKFVLH